MAIEHSGTITPATTAVEETIQSSTVAKVLTLLIDTANLTGSEQLDLWVKTKVLTGGTVRIVWYSGPMIGVQTYPIKVSIPCHNDFTMDFTIKQTGGTMRAFPWKVCSP